MRPDDVRVMKKRKEEDRKLAQVQKKERRKKEVNASCAAWL